MQLLDLSNVLFSFQTQDETLMIQTRKVQYQCMSKLSPHELASRAHQFLAEGEKRSVGHRKSTTLSSNAGMNMKLIILHRRRHNTLLYRNIPVLASN